MRIIETKDAPAAIGPYSQAIVAVCNSIYGEAFTSKPARSCVEAAALPKGALVEIEVIAEVK